MDNRDLFEETVGALKPMCNENGKYEFLTERTVQIEMYPWLILTIVILYIYQVGLAYHKHDQDSPLWKRILSSLFFIPLSVLHILRDLFRAGLILRIYYQWITARQVRRDQDQSMNENVNIGISEPQNHPPLIDLTSESVVLNIE